MGYVVIVVYEMANCKQGIITNLCSEDKTRLVQVRIFENMAYKQNSHQMIKCGSYPWCKSSVLLSKKCIV